MNDDNYGIYVTSRPGCTPATSNWMGVDGKPLILSRDMAEAMAEAANRVNGKLWQYEARELPARK